MKKTSYSRVCETAIATEELITTMQAFVVKLKTKSDDFTAKELEKITEFLVMKADDYYTI